MVTCYKMVNWSKLYAFVRFFIEVRRPDQLIHNRQKVIYTTISLLIFLTAKQLPLYGIPVRRQGTATSDPLYREHPFFGSDGLLALGIGPIILSEVITQILLVSKVINVDINAPDLHILT